MDYSSIFFLPPHAMDDFLDELDDFEHLEYVRDHDPGYAEYDDFRPPSTTTTTPPTHEE